MFLSNFLVFGSCIFYGSFSAPFNENIDFKEMKDNCDDTNCIFPFIYEGKVYNKCTIVNHPDDEAWCATEVGEDRVHFDDDEHEWEICPEHCPTDEWTEGIFEGIVNNNSQPVNGSFYRTSGSIYNGSFISGLPNGFGFLIFSNTSKFLEYKGMWRNGKKHGKGILQWKDGAYYNGNFEENRFHGLGFLTDGEWSEYGSFKGEWKHGKFNGNGTYTWKNGKYYIGNFEEGDFQGFGFLTYDKGSEYESYEGEWKHDKFNGNGTLKWKNGIIYDGHFKDDEFQGFGILVVGNNFSDNQQYNTEDSNNEYRRIINIFKRGEYLSYEGFWDEDQFNGNGTLIWKDQSQYSGEFQNGKIEGYGVKTFANESEIQSYKGFWSYYFHGNGTLVFKSGSTYCGEFTYGGMEGFGVKTFGDEFEEQSYIGFWKNGNFEGNGTLVYKNGSKFSGYFSSGVRDGIGSEYSTEGQILRQGVWINDAYIGTNGIPKGYSCKAIYDQSCVFPYNLKNGIQYQGCFWNPDKLEFQCPTKLDENGMIAFVYKCDKDCLRDCERDMWKCNDSCIPINEPCGFECFPGIFLNNLETKLFLL